MIEQQRAFVDNAAHELRTPLTSLRLRIEMLQTRGKGDAELTQHYLSQMNHELGYLQRMVDHLLALASVEGNENAAPRMPLDIARTLYAVSDEMTVVVQQAGVNFQTEIPEHLPQIEANPDQMAILVRNLIDNAIKYSPRGGTITLEATASRDEVQIRVNDTGVGIPPEALPHIFDRFFRVDAAHSRGQGGVGLGLALVRSIVEAHGGQIEVASRVNQGSKFTVHLPVRQD
jgi:signal transduction histidine kinase